MTSSNQSAGGRLVGATPQGRPPPRGRGVGPSNLTPRPERAQLVWRRALELADPARQRDDFERALDLLRVAHHDPTTMAHALTLGCTHLQAHADDAIALDGRGVLEAAITFLGAKPRPGGVAGAQGSETTPDVARR